MIVWDNYRAYVYVGIAALLSWWLLSIYQQRDTTLRVAEGGADFFSHAYHKKEMDAFGVVKSELRAETMQHFKTSGEIHLVSPVMTLYNANAAPWLIESETGIMAADGDHLQLNGKALIKREASKTARALTVNTSNLRVQLSKNYAETADWAEIINPPNKSSGTGMEVTFTSPIHLKLLSKVKGRYEIN
ncbi:MAG: LPS export ABC transporter periplasmic protein LptC [Methylomonas sp.]|nr:LPS export ABC transporter periplasmic protein LptC [Methylomonas sp.]PPD21536.1 MAG: LPS export ABC transporter periplasmic protein LptC [Methylomonas sp.]PPD26303.1 MAG: LPS export ABC transporter periplasmic protein LptC [Methylomonas sp.]PPD38020.1 MAG: LPS export ABC transporter periplasmic protein LptC [Methylomonas sp.]PPD38429.1 MAG: LPS export ABC transporter periplasmic protein LptC [Methylomonas sp.]